MKEITLLTWLTQLGLSVVLPLAGWIFLALWLRKEFALGDWVLWVGIVVGTVSAVDGLIRTLKALSGLTKSDKAQHSPVVFNDHD